MSRKRKFVLSGSCVLMLGIAAIFFTAHRKAYSMLDPIRSHAFRERRMMFLQPGEPSVAGSTPIPDAIEVIDVMHIKDLTCDQVEEAMGPQLKKNGYVRTARDLLGIITYSKLSSSPGFAPEIDIYPALDLHVDGIIVVDYHDASPLESAVDKIVTLGRTASVKDLGNDPIKFLGE